VISLAALDLRYREALWTGLDAHGSPDRCGRLLKPARGVAVDERGDRLADPRLVGIEPGDLVVLEEVGRDEGAVERRQRHRLEAQHVALALFLGMLHDDEAFDADA